ncbi:hypothetical protein M405DRAFT_525719 [Rhizopogon salebrosus TDB-379]|nr:hypothetical protein M405DRAFT_525719 [Rhizopogon salebrosus TDB-379]
MRSIVVFCSPISSLGPKTGADRLSGEQADISGADHTRVELIKVLENNQLSQSNQPFSVIGHDSSVHETNINAKVVIF